MEGIPEDVTVQVGAVLELTDGCADALFEVEHRTAFRRFLHRAVVGDASFFRRRAKPEGLAAAVCWAVASGNESFRTGLYVKDLSAWFGVGSPAGRGRKLLVAAGCPTTMHAVPLGTPDLMVREYRRQLIRRRGLL